MSEVTIPVARPPLDERCAEAARRAVLSGWVTQGPEVARFEEEFAAAVGAAHACAVSSCTAALHLALLAAGVGRGDHVLTVSHSFIATVNAVRFCGAIPVLVDIESGGFNVDASRLAAALTPQTKALLVVHQMGMPCDLASILTFSRAHGLPVIEDAACAIGSEILWQTRWERIGKPHGDVACFSFHPRKVITTGEGGMLTTSHADWDQAFRLWRQHGMTVSDTYRHHARQVVFESYSSPGYNYKMTDIQAAVGREQLPVLDQIVGSRRALAARYGGLLADLKGVRTPAEPAWARSNWQSYCIELSPEYRQREVMDGLLGKGIATRRGIMCAHREPAGREMLRSGPLTRSEQAQDCGIILPLYSQMLEADQDRVVQGLRGVLR